MIRKLHVILFLLLTAFTATHSKIYNIVVFLDGFRYDYTDRGLTPAIDTIASHGVRALSLVPVFPTTTAPNLLSALTGLLPANHGVITGNSLAGRTDNSHTGDSSKTARKLWVHGEPIWVTAAGYGIKTAVCCVPFTGNIVTAIEPDYSEHYDSAITNQQRVDKVTALLRLPYSIRPEITLVFFEEADKAGHRFGTCSGETDKAIMHTDYIIGNLVDSVRAAGLRDSTNIILVSCHGMADTDTNRLIRFNSLINGSGARVINYGAYMFIYSNDCTGLYNKLKAQEHNYRAYLKNEIPAGLGLHNCQGFPDIFLIADPGWMMEDGASAGTRLAAIHGYENGCLDMHGIFCASGPSFRNNYRSGPINITDIYPLICRIYGILPNNNIDGKAERIEFLLKER